MKWSFIEVIIELFKVKISLFEVLSDFRCFANKLLNLNIILHYIIIFK